MSKISDMYEQIKLQQYTLIKTKLQEAIKASKAKRELSKEEIKDYTFTDDEVSILMKLLEEKGFENGQDFFSLFDSDYDSPDYSAFIMKIDGDYIGLFTDTWGGQDIPTITDIESIIEKIKGFDAFELEEDRKKIVDLTDIDLEKIQIGTQSIGIDDSVETYKDKATDAKENLVRAKLREIIKDIIDGKEQSENNGLNRDNEIYVLVDMLKKAGLKEGSDFIFEEQPFEYNDTVPELYIRMNNDILNFSGMNSITDIIPIQEIEDDIKENSEYYDAKLLGLKAIELAQLGIDLDTQISESTIEEDDYEYNDDDYEYDDEYDNRYSVDIEPDDYDVIYNILRNRIPDYNANAMFGENSNFCQIGQYSDMPGEEQIAITLNSMSKESLKEYFESNPEDIILFEQMRSKYTDIEPLDEEIQKQKDAKQLFEESLIREDVVEYYLSKSPEELEASLGTEVARMVGFKQKNSHHCYDLWEHTLRTVEGIKSENLTPDQFKKLRVAAFFHDIGKPDVSQFNNKTGQQVFYGHAQHSVDVAESILSKLGYSQEEIEQLGFYIGHHDDFISYKSTLAPYMKNHEFIREIDSATVAEKIIENKFDFEAMGYDKDQVRAICYTLAHGKRPDFRVKNQPIVIDVNMDEVQDRMDSRKYDTGYDASLEDYQMLIQLCKADAGAQSEIAIQNGKIVGSKAEKLENMENIQASLPEAYRDAIEKTGNKYLANILKYATRKVEVRERNEQAARLAQDYEQQLPKEQQSLDNE